MEISLIVPLFGISVHANTTVKLSEDYKSDYKTLLEKGKTSTVDIKRMSILAAEIFKTINNLNTSFMKDIFTPKSQSKVQPNDLIVNKRHNTSKYGTKSLTTLRLQIPKSLNLKHVAANLRNILTQDLGPSITVITVKTPSNEC